MPRNKHPEETVQRILDASLKLFLEKGYEETTVLDIISELGGLTRGAFYHHFKSKEEVFDVLSEKLFYDDNPFAKAKARRDLNGLEKLKLAFAGDGINDAPVLTRADIGIAMGSMGSDAAIEAADVVLMDDDVRKIASTVHISRKTLRIVKQNIVFALGVKALVLALGAAGMANMWEAVFADVGVSVIAILNSMRALKTDDKE